MFCFRKHIVDFLSSKRISNDGILPKYYVENDHEEFYMAKEEK